MSNEWNAEMSYLTTEQKAKANEIKATIITLPAPSPRRARPQYRVKISLDGALAVLELTSPALVGVLALSELQLQPKALLEP